MPLFITLGPADIIKVGFKKPISKNDKLSFIICFRSVLTLDLEILQTLIQIFSLIFHILFQYHLISLLSLRF